VSFKMQAIGFKEMSATFQELGRQISPQVGMAKGLKAGADIIALEAQFNAQQEGLLKSGELIRSIQAVIINQYRVDIKVGVPYGAAHEFGVRVVITPRQRRFFWAMYINTQDTMWKALALSITYTIPARPYLRPAIAERKKAAFRVIADDFRKTLKTQIRR